MILFAAVVFSTGMQNKMRAKSNQLKLNLIGA